MPSEAGDPISTKRKVVTWLSVFGLIFVIVLALQAIDNRRLREERAAKEAEREAWAAELQHTLDNREKYPHTSWLRPNNTR